MTCEILIANPLGIALAADSAVTFSRNNNQRTYAAGANKIFQLSEQQPIAVMIYSNANLSGVPWELVIKTFRKKLGSRKFRAVREYAEHLIDFINNDSFSLIDEFCRSESTKQLIYQGVRIFLNVLQELNATTKEDIENAIEDHLTSISNELTLDTLDEKDIDYVYSNFLEKEKEQLIANLAQNNENWLQVKNLDAFIKFITLACFKSNLSETTGASTGLVIAGFGDDQFFPSYTHINCSGFVGNKLNYKIHATETISPLGKRSFIEAFAQRAMIETFTHGASEEVWSAVKESFEEHAKRVATTVALKAGHPKPSDSVLSEAVNEHLEQFIQSWTYTTYFAHLSPLYGIVAGMSVQELSELADTLVMLESIKEKVTSHTQSVGGPVDVAVITKNEGLVWIRRKLYFDPELNQRYVARVTSNKGNNDVI